MTVLTASRKGAKIKTTASTEPSSNIKLFLIGMMGSGKTFWADKLKKKLKVPAYDLDNLVEIMEERTIAEMFAEEGEQYFRKEEAKMLRLFKEKKNYILSCGGGTPCYNENLEWMNKQGITIFIDEPVDVLMERLKNEKEHRPLIKDLDDEQLEAFLTKKLAERKAYYSQCKYIVSGPEISENSFTKLLKEHA